MDKIWTKNYDPGVPHTIDPDQYASVPDMLEECFKQYANSPCFMNFGETLTYKQVDKLSQAYAGFLQNECKLEKGDRVAIMMPNCLQYPIALFGALRAGMVNVNISPLYNAQEIHSALEITGAKCILVLANFAHLVQSAIQNTDVKYVIVTELGDLFSPVKRLVFHFVINNIKKMIPDWQIPHAIAFKRMLLSDYQKQFKRPALSGKDLAYLQFTEGRATGKAKCAMLTHRNFVANGLQCDAFFHSNKTPFKGTIIVTMPFFKLTALTFHCLVFMRKGIQSNLITDPRDIALLIKELKRTPFFLFAAIRPLFNELLFNENFQKINFSSLRFTFSSGMGIPQLLADRWQSLTQVSITQTYAVTETSSFVMSHPLSAKTFKPSLGLPLPSTDAKICDEQGNALPLGERGEIWIYGPQVIQGYWNDPEKTKAAFTEDGWFKTGDIGYMDKEGYTMLIARKEDLIKTDQGLVYPSEVENIIHDIAGIKEVIVVGSNTQPPIIKAYIIKSGFSLTEDISEENILTHCKRHLADYQVPHEIEFCNELPRSATGFVLRYQLRERIEC